MECVPQKLYLFRFNGGAKLGRPINTNYGVPRHLFTDSGVTMLL